MTPSISVSNIRAARSFRALMANDPRALYFTSSRLLIRTSVQTRGLWRSTRQQHDGNNDHGWKRMDKYRRLCLFKMQGKAAHPWLEQMRSNHHHHWWSLGSWNRFKSSFPGHQPNGRQKDYFEAERARTQRRMEQIKRQIEADPYGILFGRKLEPFDSLKKFDDAFTSMCRSFFGIANAEKSTDTTARPKTTKPTSADVPDKSGSSKSSTGNAPKGSSGSGSGNSSIPIKARMALRSTGTTPISKTFKQIPPKTGNFYVKEFQFDPISGRMVPKSKPVASEKRNHVGAGHANVTAKNNPQSERPGYLSPIKPSGDIPTAPVSSETAGVKDMHSQDSAKTCASGSPNQETNDMSKPIAGQTLPDLPDIINIEPSNLKGESEQSIHSTEIHENKSNGHQQLPPRHSSTDVENHDRERLGSSGLMAKTEQRPVKSAILDSTQLNPTVRDERADDLDLLRASDIRSYYESGKYKKPEAQKPTRKDLDNAFDSYVDPASDIDAESIRARFKHYKTAGYLNKTTSTPGRSEVAASDSQGLENSSPSIPKDTTRVAQDSSKPNNAQHIPNSAFTETYCVLAYDPSTLLVSQAEASSSLHKAEPQHPTQILSNLNNPAKFLPYFAEMHANGYEIVSGGGDILVFRKTPKDGMDGTRSTQSAKDMLAAHVRNEPLLMDDTLQSTAQNQSLKQPTTDSSRSSDHAQAKGPPKKESRVGKTLRRMFISGVATAATCYALGVVSEYFRTGGQDGRGIDAFTEFESERRQRD